MALTNAQSRTLQRTIFGTNAEEIESNGVFEVCIVLTCDDVFGITFLRPSLIEQDTHAPDTHKWGPAPFAFGGMNPTSGDQVLIAWVGLGGTPWALSWWPGNAAGAVLAGDGETTTPTTFAFSQIIAAITAVAQKLGVNVNLALAIAMKESSFNTKAVGAGSYGLFQLQAIGGEGAGYTIAEMEDPTLNSTVALRVVAAVGRQYPGGNPGGIALLAQRPLGFVPGMSIQAAAQTSYAQVVNNYYAQLQRGVPPQNLVTP